MQTSEEITIPKDGTPSRGPKNAILNLPCKALHYSSVPKLEINRGCDTHAGDIHTFVLANGHVGATHIRRVVMQIIGRRRVDFRQSGGVGRGISMQPIKMIRKLVMVWGREIWNIA